MILYSSSEHTKLWQIYFYKLQTTAYEHIVHMYSVGKIDLYNVGTIPTIKLKCVINQIVTRIPDNLHANIIQLHHVLAKQ